jgi:hypothetical protein
MPRRQGRAHQTLDSKNVSSPTEPGVATGDTQRPSCVCVKRTPFETSKERGMGLGLSLGREIVKARGAGFCGAQQSPLALAS